MQPEDFFDLFLLLSAVHGFLFSIFLFRQGDKRKKGIIYLNFMILTIALNNFQSWLLTIEYSIVSYIQIPWHLLTAPLFYTFLLKYLQVEKRFFSFLKVVIPLFIVSIIIQLIYLSISRNSSLSTYQLLYERYTAIEEAISFITSLSLFVYSFYILRFKRHLFEQVTMYDNLKWFNVFIVLGSASYVLWAFALSMKFYLGFQNFIVFFYPLRVMTTLLIYWLGYELLFKLKQIKERKTIRKGEVSRPEKKYTDTNEKFKQIQSYLLEKNRFLDSQLSLERLAEELQVSPSKLSKIINENISENFNSLINNYRIEFSKKLLLNPAYSRYTITSVALESGFNSKSTFYSAFKKHTGITPSEFRENQDNFYEDEDGLSTKQPSFQV